MKVLTHGLVLILFSMLSVSADGARKNVTLVTDPQDSWKPAELELVTQASQIVFDRINSHPVAQCAYRSSFKEKKSDLRQRWGRQITVLNKNADVSLYLRKKTMKASIYGLAKLDIATIDRRYFKVHNLDIMLNEANLHKDKQIYPGANAIDIWVNTIAHELAHNFGYGHGNSGVWIDDYPGFFPTELGFCVMSNGKFGSDLNDAKRRRLLQKNK